MGFFDDVLDGLEGGETAEKTELPPIARKPFPRTEEEPVQSVEEEFVGSEYESQDGVQQEDPFDQQMSEAERRLAKALLYKQWVGGRLFDGDSTDLTREVEKEIGDFVKERLSILLGCDVPKSQPQVIESSFTPLETSFLKLFISRTLNMKPKLKLALEKERLITAIMKPEPVKPTIKPRQQPEAAKPSIQPRIASSKPQIQTRPLQKTKEDVLPQDGELITEGSRKYKAKWVQMDPTEYGEKVEILLSNLPFGKHIKLPKPGAGAGVLVYKVTDTDYFKILKLDVTPQTQNTQGVPMPQDMALATAIQAGVAVSNMSKGVRTIAETVEKLAKKQEQ